MTGLSGKSKVRPDAGLHRGLGKAALIASGKTFGPSTTAAGMSWTPRLRNFGHHREPDHRAFVLGDPETENLALTVAGDAERKVDRLVAHDPAVLVPDLHPQRVEDHDRIDRLQRPGPPFLHLVEWPAPIGWSGLSLSA